jgi:heterodisulfide reductase subunit B2
MKYLYYPGCSLEGTAKEYDISTRNFMAAVGAELQEIDDWTCCGASAAESMSQFLSLALPARNLALAERMTVAGDILVPCSACYLNLKKVEDAVQTDPEALDRVNALLDEEGLAVRGTVRVRHLLDVVASDIGPENIRSRVKTALSGIRIAPYYGCQCLRPYRIFDDPERPRSMEPLIESVGATVHDWDMGARCCGAAHMNTKMDVGLQLVGAILKGARGADAVVTVCPMCQMNLEAYQKAVSARLGEDLRLSVIYLPQLLGLALGLPEKSLRLDLNLAVTADFRKKIAA